MIYQWPRSVALIVLVFTFCVLSLGQEEPEFRAQSNIVLVPALVRNKSGSIIYGLKADAFIVEDDGVPQMVHLKEVSGNGTDIAGRNRASETAGQL